MEHFYVDFGNPSCSGFSFSYHVEQQTHRQTNAAKPYHHDTVVVVGNKYIKGRFVPSQINLPLTLMRDLKTGPKF